MDARDRLPLFGLLVGGASRRMGGTPKGLLLAPEGTPLVRRLIAEIELAAPGADVLLVGNAEPYRNVGLPVISDAPAGVGPLGGLRALLLEAKARGRLEAVALACDLPFLTRALIRRLAMERRDALALAPRDGLRWEPLCARYAVEALAALDAGLATGNHALQAIFERLGERAVPLALDARERAELHDWDTPEDVTAPKTPSKTDPAGSQ